LLPRNRLLLRTLRLLLLASLLLPSLLGMLRLLRFWGRLRALLLLRLLFLRLRLWRPFLGALLLRLPRRSLPWPALLFFRLLRLFFLGLLSLRVGRRSRTECQEQGSSTGSSNEPHNHNSDLRKRRRRTCTPTARSLLVDSAFDAGTVGPAVHNLPLEVHISFQEGGCVSAEA
jgi:hypothetical protein